MSSSAPWLSLGWLSCGYMGIRWSIHKNDGWRGQLERIHRWYSRVVQAANAGDGDLEDFIFTFFQNCYHLREWMQRTSDVSRSDVDALFTQTPELRLCRDICNGTKHLTLRDASVDAHFSIGREYNPGSPSGYRLFLIADDKYDLLELASRCVEILDAFASTKPPPRREPERHCFGMSGRQLSRLILAKPFKSQPPFQAFDFRGGTFLRRLLTQNQRERFEDNGHLLKPFVGWKFSKVICQLVFCAGITVIFVCVHFTFQQMPPPPSRVDTRPQCSLHGPMTGEMLSRYSLCFVRVSIRFA